MSAASAAGGHVLKFAHRGSAEVAFPWAVRWLVVLTTASVSPLETLLGSRLSGVRRLPIDHVRLDLFGRGALSSARAGPREREKRQVSWACHHIPASATPRCDGWAGLTLARSGLASRLGAAGFRCVQPEWTPSSYPALSRARGFSFSCRNVPFFPPLPPITGQRTLTSVQRRRTLDGVC